VCVSVCVCVSPCVCVCVSVYVCRCGVMWQGWSHILACGCACMIASVATRRSRAKSCANFSMPGMRCIIFVLCLCFRHHGIIRCLLPYLVLRNICHVVGGQVSLFACWAREQCKPLRIWDLGLCCIEGSNILVNVCRNGPEIWGEHMGDVIIQGATYST
jgi:hypothetical protein